MLNEQKRLKLLRKIAEVVEDNFYDSELLQSEWPRSVKKHTDQIVYAPTDEAFETAVGNLLLELKSSHIGFYHTGFEILKQDGDLRHVCPFPFRGWRALGVSGCS
jgi:hypothetical protein